MATREWGCPCPYRKGGCVFGDQELARKCTTCAEAARNKAEGEKPKRKKK